MEVVREITPLTQNDCFMIFSREKTEFSFPLHHHEDIEINLIINAAGAQRIVGDHIGEIGDLELVCVGSQLAHGWFTHHCQSKAIKEVTIQFHPDLFGERFLNRNQLVNIRNMFENAKRGILFARPTADRMASRLLSLGSKVGFESMLEFFSIIHELSLSTDNQLLSESTFITDKHIYNSRRIERVFSYMNENFDKQVTLNEVSKIAGMPEASFSRFIKQRTGYSFVESLNEIRLGHVTRMLIDTTESIAEIAFKCGFNNMSHFNRIFKSKKNLTPKDFREAYIGRKIFV